MNAEQSIARRRSTLSYPYMHRRASARPIGMSVADWRAYCAQRERTIAADEAAARKFNRPLFGARA